MTIQSHTELAAHKALHLLKRYASETPLGYQPHMIALEAAEVIEQLSAALESPTPPERVQPETEKREAVLSAAREWSAERMPSDWCEADLMKAIVAMEGDWPGCDECDHQCDEPCAPATVEEMLARIDSHIADQVHSGKLGAYIGYAPPSGWKPSVRIKRVAPTPPTAPAQASEGAVAWMHIDDPRRVISALQREGLIKDGGASASSVSGYSMPLVHMHEAAALRASSPAYRKPLTDEQIDEAWDQFWAGSPPLTSIAARRGWARHIEGIVTRESST